MTALKCRCRTVRHAIAAEDRRKARLGEQDAIESGSRDLVAFYGQRLLPCPTAAPSQEQRALLAGFAERAGVGR